MIKEPEFTIEPMTMWTKRKEKLNRPKFKYNNLAPHEEIRDFWLWKQEKFRKATEKAMQHPEIPLRKIGAQYDCHYQEISKLLNRLKKRHLILET